MNSSRSTSRRMFLKTSAGLLAAGAAAPYFYSSAQAQSPSSNDRRTVAAIGVSTYVDRWGTKGMQDGRGAVVGRQAAKLANLVACCDVNRAHAERFAAPYDGKCEIYGDFRKLLERKDLDAVTIGTPDHWHVAIAIAALRAGKDVYCEKPLTLTIDEGKRICAAVRETGRVLQVGTQQRSEYDLVFLRAVVLARSGRLGKNLRAVSSVGTAERGGPFPNGEPPAELNWDFWLGQTPQVPYCKQRCDYDFRYWLEYSGGQVTDWGVHHTDIALWALGQENTGPVEIEGTGDFPRVENGYNVASTFDCRMRFADNSQIRLLSGPNELLLEGDLGRIRVNRGGLTGKPYEDLTKQEQQWLDEEVVKLYGGKQPGDHMRNFFECIADRSQPISDVFSHHRTVSACHLSNITMRLGRKLRWDPEKERFPDDAEANAMLSRPQRSPYSLDELT